MTMSFTTALGKSSYQQSFNLYNGYYPMVHLRENTSIKFQLLSYCIDTDIVDKELILYLRTENNECLSFASG